MGLTDSEKDAKFFETEFDPAMAVVYAPAGFADLMAAVKMRDTAQRMVDEAVVTARQDGLTWPQIAVALGISPQGARQKYKDAVDQALMSA